MNQTSIAPLLLGNILGSASNSFVIAEWQDEGGPAGPPRLIAPRHLHHKDDEAWYVLEGTLALASTGDDSDPTIGNSRLVRRLDARAQLFPSVRVS